MFGEKNSVEHYYTRHENVKGKSKNPWRSVVILIDLRRGWCLMGVYWIEEAVESRNGAAKGLTERN